jgi:CRP-like cAMP-binding protein
MESSRLWYLKRIHLFRGLDEDRIEQLRETAPPRLYRRRQLLFGPEDPADTVYLVQKGRVRLSRFDAAGREITLAVLEEGELFGEESTPDGEGRDGFAEALDETEVLRIPQVEYERLLQSSPDLAVLVARQLSERLLGSSEGLRASVGEDPGARLAGVLVALAKRHGEDAGEGSARLALRVAFQELAALVGAPRDVVEELLQTWRREGRLRTTGGAMVLEDLAGFEALIRAAES